jgi:hypothetical protein
MDEARRFQELSGLLAARLREYAELLENQQRAIEAGDAAKALGYCELETQALDRIGELKNALALQEHHFTGGNLPDEIGKLREQIKAQIARNRGLLKPGMTEIRRRMETLKNPYRNTRSIYAQGDAGAQAVQIDA